LGGFWYKNESVRGKKTLETRIPSETRQWEVAFFLAVTMKGKKGVLEGRKKKKNKKKGEHQKKRGSAVVQVEKRRKL